jgi:hypothetical protein
VTATRNFSQPSRNSNFQQFFNQNKPSIHSSKSPTFSLPFLLPFFCYKKMKKVKHELFTLPNRLTLIQTFMMMMILYMLFMSFEIPLAFKAGLGSETVAIGFLTEAMPLLAEQNLKKIRPFRLQLKKVSTLSFNNRFEGVSELYKVAKHAYISGNKLWEEVESGKVKSFLSSKIENGSDSCLNSVTVSGFEFKEKLKGVMVLPCGLTLWSHVTVVGTPRWAHVENDSKIGVVKDRDEAIMVSQFMLELQGLKAVDNEEPPRILHFNPRIKGDWSGKPVIEQNTCYRMQWGTALRCEGWKSRADEETGK